MRKPSTMHGDKKLMDQRYTEYGLFMDYTAYLQAQNFLVRLRRYYRKRIIPGSAYAELRKMALEGKRDEAQEKLAKIVDPSVAFIR